MKCCSSCIRDSNDVTTMDVQYCEIQKQGHMERKDAQNKPIVAVA